MTSRNFEQFLTPHLSVIKLFRNMANILSSQNHWPPLSLMIVLSFMDNPLLKSYDNREARQQFIREQVRSVGTIFLFEIQVHQKWVHKKFRMYNIRKLILGPSDLFVIKSWFETKNLVRYNHYVMYFRLLEYQPKDMLYIKNRKT